jgi:Pentapeptide repeats (8 copies)
LEKNKDNSNKLLEISFNMPIKNLQHNKVKIPTSLSEIYDLEQMAKDYPEHHWKIMEILARFIRNNARNPPRGEIKNNPLPIIPTDIQLAITIIATRNGNKDPKNQLLDLSNTDMSRANLQQANLSGANLYQTNLSGANLRGAKLDGAILSAANLSEANLRGANLDGAILCAANLEGANLKGASLHRANLYLAKLHQANLNDAILHGANLRDTD